MTWASLVISAIVAISSLVALVVIALRFFRHAADVADRFTVAHESTLASLDRIHSRNMEQLSTMADRFMALDFSQFKAYSLSEAAEEGGFEEPEVDYGRTGVERPLPGGRYARVGAADEQTLEQRAHEQELLSEDFPPGWDEETQQ